MIKAITVEIIDSRLRMNSETRFFTSLEGENPGGSIKDRMVLGEIQALLKAGGLKPGDGISEISSGSTARALAYYAKECALRCSLFVPNHLPQIQIDLLRSLGAKVYPVEVSTAYEQYQRFLGREKVHPLNQLGDLRLSRHYAPLGQMVGAEVGPIELVIGAVGTGHSLVGITQGFIDTQPTLRPRKATAEPLKGAIPGVRNIETERHGPTDACTPAWFDDRVVLDAQQYFPDLLIETSVGKISFPASFQLVLGAAQLLASKTPQEPQSFFLVGAANCRRLPFTTNCP